MNTMIDFQKPEYLEYCSKKLTELLLANQGMKALVDLGAHLIGNPIAVGTTSLTVLYTSRNMPPQVPMAKPGIISPDFSTDKSFIKYNEAAYNSSKPVLTEEQYGGYKTLLLRLSLHGEIVGYMSILFCEQLYTPAVEPAALLLRQVIECELARHTALISRSQTVSELLLSDILSSKSRDLNSNTDAIIRLGLNKQSTFYLLVFNMIGFSKAIMPGADIKDELQTLTGAVLSIYHNGNVVQLKQGSIRDLMPEANNINHAHMSVEDSDTGADRPDAAAKNSALRMFMHKHGLCGGISYGSRQIADLPGCYKQAILAMTYAKNQDLKTIMPYDYVVVPEFIKNIIDRHHLNYRLPEIKIIDQYDRTHRTNYRHVLKTFIENEKNVSMTAARTGLSKSSVYRILDRIKLMTGLDFDQNDHLFAIYLGLKIEAYNLPPVTTK